jgi:hypothetical protein
MVRHASHTGHAKNNTVPKTYDGQTLLMRDSIDFD